MKYRLTFLLLIFASLRGLSFNRGCDCCAKQSNQMRTVVCEMSKDFGKGVNKFRGKQENVEQPQTGRNTRRQNRQQQRQEQKNIKQAAKFPLLDLICDYYENSGHKNAASWLLVAEKIHQVYEDMGNGWDEDVAKTHKITLEDGTTTLMATENEFQLYAEDRCCLKLLIKKVKESVDSDKDKIPDSEDNCPKHYNPHQEDEDGDKRGDECDNCPKKKNNDQEDEDKDEVGDECDNCPKKKNKGQIDKDKNGVGDDCEEPPIGDNDNDTFPNNTDNCPNIPNDQKDKDNDKKGDTCDNCPLDYNPDQKNTYGDLRGDACEPRPKGTFTVIGAYFSEEIFFVPGKHYITDYSKSKLDNVVKQYYNCGNCIITLSGFADDAGSEKLNDRLSWDRARNVELYLLQNGVPTHKQHTTGYGEKGDGSFNQRKVIIAIYTL